AEHADDELAIAGFRKRIVDARGEPEIVGRHNVVSSLACAELRREIERNTWSMRRAEIRMQANGSQRVAAPLLDARNGRPVRIDVEQPAVLVIENSQREHFRAQDR